jgi:hypothetical protein
MGLHGSIRVLAALAATAVALVALAPPAAAGGSWLDPVLDTYRPGETATLVGYVGAGQQGWVDDGPFPAYLRTQPPSSQPDAASETDYVPPGAAPGDVPLGPLSVVETGRKGWLELRISISFLVPADLEPGSYEVVYCSADCTTGIGDLIGGWVWVGVAPGFPISRGWPADDPAWALRGEPAPRDAVPAATAATAATAAAKDDAPAPVAAVEATSGAHRGTAWAPLALVLAGLAAVGVTAWRAVAVSRRRVRASC